MSSGVGIARPDLRAHDRVELAWFEARRIAGFDLGLDVWHPSWPERLPFSLEGLLVEDLGPALLAGQLRRLAATGTDVKPR